LANYKDVNLLLNDVTYVLDESFGAFKTNRIFGAQWKLSRMKKKIEPIIP